MASANITIKLEGVEVAAVVAAVVAATTGVVELFRDTYFIHVSGGRKWRVGYEGDKCWVSIPEVVLDDLRAVSELLAAVRS